MKVAVSSAQSYDRDFLTAANDDLNHELVFFEGRISEETVKIFSGFQAICAFVNDTLNERVLKTLSGDGLQLIALRCAGFNNVDVKAAAKYGVRIVRVPAYSPYSVAEHTLALILALNRKIHRAYNRVRDGNFALDGLMGHELRNQTVGIIGTGRIGLAVAQILKGFGCICWHMMWCKTSSC